MQNKKKKKKFNLQKLEEHTLEAYQAYLQDDSQFTRTKLFEGIRELAYAILSVGDWRSKYNIEPEEAAYEYALYLFERIITGFELKSKNGQGFALQSYITINIRHTVITVRDDELFKSLIGDMQFLIDNQEAEYQEEQQTADSALIEEELSEKLFRAIRFFYPLDEIKRLLPIAIEMMYDSNIYMIPHNAPTDIRDFCITLVAIAKRIVKDENIVSEYDFSKRKLKDIFASGIRSSVFLSTVVDTGFFPKELLLCLDMDSLHRLISVMGGQKIKIPNQRHLDALLGSVVTVSKMAMEGKPKVEALDESKKNLDLVFANRINMNSLISKAAETYDLFGADTPTKPMMNALLCSIESLKKVVDDMAKRNQISDKHLKQFEILTEDFIKWSEAVEGVIPKANQNYQKEMS